MSRNDDTKTGTPPRQVENRPGDSSRSEFDPIVGTTIANKYKVNNRIAEGSMGVIYDAKRLSDGHHCVVKLLHRALLGDKSIVGRFEREAKASSLIKHTNCIEIHDFGSTEDGALYIAMEFLKGRNLAYLIDQEERISTLYTIHIAKQICDALTELHNQGVIHRDLKPENVMLLDGEYGHEHVKVLDFGIAKIQETDDPAAFQTMAGIVCGSPFYMSPEQARGESLDGRSDLYSLGILLYEMVTGDVPFSSNTPMQIFSLHVSKAPTDPKDTVSNLSEAMNSLILKLLEKNRQDRPATALTVRKYLERIEMTILDIADTVQASVADLSPIDENGDTGIMRHPPAKISREEEKAALQQVRRELHTRATSRTDLSKNTSDLSHLQQPLVLTTIALVVIGLLYYFL